MFISQKISLRHAFAILACLSSVMLMNAQVHKGETSIGPKIGYVTKNKSAYTGLAFQYAFSDHFRLAPELGYVFRHNNMDAMSLDLNAQMPFGFTGERVAFFPMAGLNYSSWSHHFSGESLAEDDDVSTRTGRFGLNLGAGFELRCTQSMKISLEAKYCLMKGYTTAVIAAGISYVF